MNDFFVCSCCKTVDMVELAHGGVLPPRRQDQKCTMCLTGAWHGYFNAEKYIPGTHDVVNMPSGIGFG